MTVAISTELNLLTAKELGTLAKELSIFGWHTMRKDKLISVLALKSRTKLGRELIRKRLAKLYKTTSKYRTISAKPEKKKIEEKKEKKISSSSASSKLSQKLSHKLSPKLLAKLSAKTSRKTSRHKSAVSSPAGTKDVKDKDIKDKYTKDKYVKDKNIKDKVLKDKDVKDKDIKDRDVKDKDIKDRDVKDKDIKDKDVKDKDVKDKDVKDKDVKDKDVKDKDTKDKDVKKEIFRKQNAVIIAVEPNKDTGTASQYRKKLRRDISTHTDEGREDRLVLLVRDPFWLHAFWEITARTVERAKVALGMFWHTSLPIIRLFRLESDGITQPKRSIVRDILIHGGVNNWYLDVMNPPSVFQIELGYISREKKFYSLVSSNIVETPQQQVIDELDNLDGNWRGVAEDLGRIYKLSGGDNNNQELKKIFEEQLHRPMSAPLLSRYRASQHQGLGSEKTRRNFLFNIDVDIIIHGKTDPSVQVTIRNEPIKVQPDGSFGIRFALPEKRHVFPMEAEGSDGVETQRAILTVERNTRILETLFQEPSDDD